MGKRKQKSVPEAPKRVPHTGGVWRHTAATHAALGETFGVKTFNEGGTGGNWVLKAHPLNGEADDLLEAKANAQLCAAAPELLEVCKTSLGNLLSIGRQFPETYGPWIEALRTAIAKATGGA